MITFTFKTPWDAKETQEAIVKTVLSIGGEIADDGWGELNAKWKIQPGRFSLSDRCTFYVGDGCVRAITDSRDEEIIELDIPLWMSCMRFWNTFVEQLLRLYPDIDFGICPGDAELVAVEIVGDDEVYVTKTKGYTPLEGAIIGGALFGKCGAVIGALSGTNETETTVMRFPNRVLARVRYSNGFVNECPLWKDSKVYHVIMANIEKYNKPVDFN